MPLYNPLFDNIIINLANSFGEVLRPPIGEYLNALPKGILPSLSLTVDDITILSSILFLSFSLS